MGSIIRPARFSAIISRSPPASRKRRRMVDGRLVGMVIAGIGLAGILALAGAAFAVRAILVLCFATLAGRTRTTVR